MELTGSLASQSYMAAINAASPTPNKIEPEPTSFLQKYATEFVGEMQQNEQVVRDGLMGRADMQSVVAAMAATEIAVETAVTVRDKVVEAYQEILRMPV